MAYRFETFEERYKRLTGQDVSLPLTQSTGSGMPTGGFEATYQRLTGVTPMPIEEYIHNQEILASKPTQYGGYSVVPRTLSQSRPSKKPMASSHSAKNNQYSQQNFAAALSNAMAGHFGKLSIPEEEQRQNREAAKQLAENIVYLAQHPKKALKAIGKGGEVGVHSTFGQLTKIMELPFEVFGKQNVFGGSNIGFQNAARIREAYLNDPNVTPAEKALMQAAEPIVNIVASGAAGQYAKFVPLLSKAPEIAQMIPFGVSAAGSYAKEAEMEGASPIQQLAYGVVMGTLEGASEKIPFEEWMKIAGGKTGIKNWIKGMTVEGLQEAIMDPASAISKKFLGVKRDIPWAGEGGVFDLRQMGESFAGGVGTGALMDIGAGAVNVTNNVLARIAQRMQQQNLPKSSPPNNIKAENRPPQIDRMDYLGGKYFMGAPGMFTPVAPVQQTHTIQPKQESIPVANGKSIQQPYQPGEMVVEPVSTTSEQVAGTNEQLPAQEIAEPQNESFQTVKEQAKQKYLELRMKEDVAEKNAELLADAIINHKPTSILYPYNQISRKIYEEITGRKLPKTQKGTDEVVSAVNYTPPETPKRYKVRTKDGYKFVRGFPVKFDELPDFEFFVFKDSNNKKWTLSEKKTGLKATDYHSSREEAIDAFKRLIAKHGADKIRENIYKSSRMDGQQWPGHEERQAENLKRQINDFRETVKFLVSGREAVKNLIERNNRDNAILGISKLVEEQRDKLAAKYSESPEIEAEFIDSVFALDAKELATEIYDEVKQVFVLPKEPTFKHISEFGKRVQKGEATAQEVRDHFQYMLDHEAEIKQSIMDYINSSDKYKRKRKDTKEKLVNDTFDRELERLAYAGGDVIRYDPFSGDPRQNLINAIRQNLEQLTDEAIQATAEKRREIEERYRKTFTNPETLEQFEDFIRVRGMDALTPEQKTRYDELVAERAKQQKAREQERKATVAQVKTDTGMRLHETRHTKTGEPRFVVTLDDRVEREVFNKLNRAAKQLGGYYSAYRGNNAIPGFTFKTREAAEKFMALRDGDVSRVDELQGRQDKSKQDAAERLKALAERIEEKAREELSRDRLTNTPKRAREAAYAEEQARKDLALAETIKNIAKAIENGEIKYLDGIRAKTHVDLLETLLIRAKYEANKQKESDSMSYSEQQELHYREPDELDVQFVEYPYPGVHADHLERLINNPLKAKSPGYAVRLRKLIEKTPDKGGYKLVTFQTESEVELLRRTIDKLESLKVDDYALRYLKEALADYDRMKAMGIESLPHLRAALREYLQYRGAKQKADPIKELERSLVGIDIPGYFPTPKAVVDRMIEIAEIEPGMKVLEPSAGKGNIADAIKEAGITPDVIEINSTLRDVLEAKKYNLVADDFLEFNEGGYDRIIMNPPFEKGQDIDHVRHAYDLLKPGGKLVAIMSEGPFFRNDKKAKEFREWLESVGGRSEKLPEGSFKSSERPTGVATRLVVIENENILLSKKEGDVSSKEEFNKWFEGSKVVDDQGKPLKVYHGTANSFDEFSNEFVGKSLGHPNDINYQKGFFFTTDIEEAEFVSKEAPGNNPTIIEAYINIKKPYIVKIKNDEPIGGINKTSEPSVYYDNMADEIMIAAEESESDGIIVKNIETNKQLIIPFEPDQIKIIKKTRTSVKGDPIKEADKKLEQMYAESGEGLKHSKDLAIAAGTFERIERVKQAIDVLFNRDDQVKASDAQVEKVLTATKSPLNIRAHLRATIKSIGNGFRDIFQYEWTVKNYPKFQDELRRFKGVSRDAQKFALDKVVKITSFLKTPKEFELFRRMVFLRDLKEGLAEKEAEALKTADNLKELTTTGNLTMGQIDKAINEIWKMAGEESTKRIKNALKAHDLVFEALWDDLKARGKVSPAAENRSHYVPHRVLDYMQDVDSRFPGLSRRFKAPYRYYLQARTGSKRLIDTDYIGVTMRHLAKFYMDNAYDDFQLYIATEWDVRPKLTDEQKKKIGKVIPNRLYEIDGKWYKGWQYDPGRVIYSRESIAEDVVMEAIEELAAGMLTVKELAERLEEKSKSLPTLGGYKKVYLLPVEIADRLTNFRAPEYTSKIFNALRKANQAYKSILFSPFSLGLPFHISNTIGDFINLYRDDPAAFRYIGEAWEAAKQWQDGEVEDKYRDLIELAEKMRVAEASLMRKAGVPYHPQLAKLQPRRYALRKLNLFAKVDELAERRELLPRFMKLMADMKRIEKGEMPKANFLDVAKLKEHGMDSLEIAGKLAREITVDYDKLTPEGKSVLRDLLFPFISFYAQNFANWTRYVARRPDDFALKFVIPMVLMTIWNWLRYGDEEEKLPDYYRVMPHLITGYKDKSGKMIIIALQTPVELAAKIVGLEKFPDIVRRVKNGSISFDEGIAELGKSVISGPWESAKDLFTPILKAPLEAYALNRSMFNGRKVVPERLLGTPEGEKLRLKYVIGQWINPVGSWNRNARDDDNILESAKKYFTKGPADVGRAFGVRHVDLGREQINRFYEELEDLENRYKSVKEARRRGEKPVFKDLARLRVFRRLSHDFSNQYKVIERIRRSKLSESKKEDMIDKIMANMARRAELVLRAGQK